MHRLSGPGGGPSALPAAIGFMLLLSRADAVKFFESARRGHSSSYLRRPSRWGAFSSVGHVMMDWPNWNGCMMFLFPRRPCSMVTAAGVNVACIEVDLDIVLQQGYHLSFSCVWHENSALFLVCLVHSFRSISSATQRGPRKKL